MRGGAGRMAGRRRFTWRPLPGVLSHQHLSWQSDFSRPSSVFNCALIFESALRAVIKSDRWAACALPAMAPNAASLLFSLWGSSADLAGLVFVWYSSASTAVNFCQRLRRIRQLFFALASSNCALRIFRTLRVSVSLSRICPTAAPAVCPDPPASPPSGAGLQHLEVSFQMNPHREPRLVAARRRLRARVDPAP